MRIGFIGLGLMGEPMSINLVKKSGKKVMVYDLDSAKVDMIVAEGAEKANSIEEVGQNCDVVISMVPKSEHVVSVYNELLKVAKKDQIFIDMSTIDPKVSIEISKKIAEKGAIMLDAPVVKSRPAAISGVLGIYVGGEEKTFQKVEEILKCMGNNVIYLGENGKGLMMKLCHNTLVAEIQNGVNEMITVAQKSGIEINDFIKAISYGGGQNFYLDGKGKSIAEGNYTTAFSVENMHKDIHLTAKVLNDLGLQLPGVEASKSVYDKAMEKGYGKEDFCATIKVVRD
ncbi:MAG: NAD(P)-dependent oxidoreductase [Fusobacteriaceae bacterium]